MFQVFQCLKQNGVVMSGKNTRKERVHSFQCPRKNSRWCVVFQYWVTVYCLLPLTSSYNAIPKAIVTLKDSFSPIIGMVRILSACEVQ